MSVVKNSDLPPNSEQPQYMEDQTGKAGQSYKSDHVNYLNIVTNSSPLNTINAQNSGQTTNAGMAIRTQKSPPPLQIDMSKRQVANGTNCIYASQPQAQLDLPQPLQATGINTTSSPREPFFSSKKGIDVTRLLKQRKDMVTEKRIEQARMQKNSQLQLDRKLLSDSLSPSEAKTVPDEKSLSQALHITQKKFNLSRLEEGQLVTGIESIVRSLLFPADQSQMESQRNGQTTEEQSAIVGGGDAETVNYQPLNDGFEPSSVLPFQNSLKDQPASIRRSLVLPSRNSTNNSSQMEEINAWHQMQNSTVIVGQHREPREQREKNIIDSQTRIILKHLSDEQKLHLINIFNSVSLTDRRAEVIALVEEMILKLKSKMHRQELSRIKKDMKRSNKKIQEINERFLSDNSMMGVPMGGANDAMGQIGGQPLKEPPYTITYKQERRERLQRRKLGLPIYQTTTKSNLSVPQRGSHSDDSQGSSVQEIHYPKATLTTQARISQRLRSQQTTNGGGRRPKLAIRRSQQQYSSKMDKAFEDDDQRNMCSPTQANDQTQQRSKGIFSPPAQNMHKFRIGNSVMSSKSNQTSRNLVRERRQHNLTQVKNKLLSNTVLQDDSVYTERNLLASVFTPHAFHSNSLEQVNQEADANGITFDSYQKQLGLNAMSSRSPVRVNDSVELDPNSASKNTIASKNQHVLSGGRIQLLDNYASDLISSQATFEKQVDDSSMDYAEFTKLINNHTRKLDITFKKSFKLGTAAQTLPPAVNEVITNLIDGYQGALNAFSKYSLRQKQQTDYKIERLSRVCADMKQERQKARDYDQFLKKKLENLRGEMNKIEVKIRNFNENSLRGYHPDNINDSFSEVTAYLDAIANDLSQERVPLPTGDFDAGPSVEASGKQSPNQPQQPTKRRGQGGVVQVSVMPFREIKKQIDDNYCEIQRNTTKAVIARLGLGTKKPVYDEKEAMTDFRIYDAEEFKEQLDKARNAEALVKKLEKDLAAEKGKASILASELTEKQQSEARLSNNIADIMHEVSTLKAQIGEMQHQLDLNEANLAEKTQKIEELQNCEKKLQEVVVQTERKVIEKEEQVKTAEEQCVIYKREVSEIKIQKVQVAEKLAIIEKEKEEQVIIIELKQAEIIEQCEKHDKLQEMLEEARVECVKLRDTVQSTKMELAKMFENYKTAKEITAAHNIQLPKPPLKENPSVAKVPSQASKNLEVQRPNSNHSSQKPKPEPKPIVPEQPKQMEPQPSAKKIQQKVSDITLQLEAPLSEPQAKQQRPIKPTVEVHQRLSEDVVTIVAPNGDAETQQLTPVLESSRPQPAGGIKSNPTRNSDLEVKENPEAKDSASQVVVPMPVVVDDDSAVSSAENDDRIVQPLEITPMPKMRRQATMCATKFNLMHKTVQTIISGPVIIDPNPPDQSQEIRSELVGQLLWQPIYAFSYDSNQPLNLIRDDCINELKRPNEDNSAKKYHGAPALVPTSPDEEEVKVITQGVTVNSELHGKSTPIKKGKLAKGLILTKENSNIKKAERMKLRKPFIINNLGQTMYQTDYQVGETYDDTRMSLTETLNQMGQLIKKHSSFWVDEPHMRPGSRLSPKMSPDKDNKGVLSAGRFSTRKKRRSPNASSTVTPSRREGLNNTELKTTNLQLPSTINSVNQSSVYQGKKMPSRTSRRSSAH